VQSTSFELCPVGRSILLALHLDQVRDSSLKLSYDAGVETLDSIELNTPLDPKFEQNLIFSGDFRRISVACFLHDLDSLPIKVAQVR
jgi:hypothetical protein